MLVLVCNLNLYPIFDSCKKMAQHFFAAQQIFGPSFFANKFFGPNLFFAKQNQLISAKQPNLIMTRNGFDIIVN